MRTLEHAAFATLLKGYYALSFQLSQGYPPLECVYNVLFCHWVRQEFLFPKLSGEDIALMLPTLSPPKHHLRVRAESITHINGYAAASFVATWNALFCPEAGSPYQQLCQRMGEQISNELLTFDPADALHLLENGKKDALLEIGIQHLAGMDSKFLLLGGRPQAPAGRAFKSFVREYILYGRDSQHEFFRDLMQCWRERWLQNDIRNQKAIRYLGMAAAIWQERHTGEAFYPPQWPEEVSYLSHG
ncbi:hypothetical protein KSF_107110 [Reticulibacter mediterranei]|uniref:Uncharacterized protein n=1 Tax=Reticulibacter mediterranei TaxID=2778369 RepID=A0A8J3IY73_9CHLR|nr:hypothetical protein [Reticulibacter mediterranei]GHP00664.1 hypothetical protein KSF_107110 [Reticulibacter mediterranei]